MLKNRKPFLLITSGAVLALAGGASLGYWLSGQQQGRVSLPTGSQVVPQTVLASVTLSTNPMQWRQMRALGTPTSRQVLDNALVEWRDRLLTQNGYNFTRDIQPWVGEEVTVALFPPASPAETPDPQPAQIPPPERQTVLAIFPIAKPEVAQQALMQPRTTPGQQVTTRDYQGVQLWQVDGEGDRDYAATVLDGRYLVMASTPQVAEQAIDAYQDKTGLESNADYRRAFSDLATPQPFLRVYVNAPQLKAIATANNLQPVPVLPLTPLQNNQGMAATVAVGENSLQIRGVNWLPNDSPIRYSADNAARRVPSLLPDTTLVMAAGSDLQEFWQRYSQTATAPPSHPLNPNTFQEGLRSLTGLDLSQDLLSWMTGDFSLSLVPLPTPTASLQTGLLLTVQTGDRRAAENTLKKLDEVMRSRHQFQVTPTQVKGQPVTNWVSPFGALAFSHGWLDDRTAFLVLGPSIAGAILPKPERALAESPPFAAIAGDNAPPSHGQFFVNLDGLLGNNPPIPLPSLPPDLDGTLRAIRTIRLSTTIQDARSTRFEMNVQLKREGTVVPLPDPQTP